MHIQLQTALNIYAFQAYQFTICNPHSIEINGRISWNFNWACCWTESIMKQTKQNYSTTWNSQLESEFWFDTIKQVEKKTNTVEQESYSSFNWNPNKNNHYAHTNAFFVVVCREFTCKMRLHVYVFIKLIIQITYKYSAFIVILLVQKKKENTVPTSLISRSLNIDCKNVNL